jgi:transmembrane sensor
MNATPNEDPALRSQAVDWLRRLEQAPSDVALRAEIDAWLSQDVRHRQAYDDAASLWTQAPKPEPEAIPAPDLATALPGGLPNGPVLWDRTQALPRRWGVAAMAGLALLAAAAFVAFPTVQLWTMADHRTGAGELREIALDDGSRLTLDGRTAIAVSFTAAQRTVDLLSGQAFFEVAPAARPFVVTARGVTIRVAATASGKMAFDKVAFDVTAPDEGVAVAVQSGAVSVSEAALGAIAEVTAGLQLKLPRNRGPFVEPIRPGEVAAWRDRRLAFHGTTLRDAVREIARSLDTIVVFADERIADQPVTATVDLSRPDEALRTVVQLKDGRVTTFTPYLTVISSRSLLGSP